MLVDFEREVTRMNNTIPYGYTIKNGVIIADELRSKQVQDFFRLYLDGLGLKEAGKQSGINKQHSVMKHILMNEIYVGTEIYPQIVDDDTFHQAHLEQEKRGKHLRKPQKAKPVERKEIPIQFEMGTVIETYSDPFKQAQYAYSKIKEAK